MPLVPPYSSTTMARWTFMLWKSRSRSSIIRFSGTKKGCRSKAFQSTLSSLRWASRSLAYRMPLIWSSPSVWMGTRLNPHSAMSPLIWPQSRSWAKAVTSVRGVMICLTSFDPKLTMPLRMRFSSSVRSSESVTCTACSRSSTERSGGAVSTREDNEVARAFIGCHAGRSTVRANFSGRAMVRARPRGFRLACTLGSTSPNSTIRKVTPNTCSRTLSHAGMAGSQCCISTVDRRMMRMLTALFRTRMVASS